jgi:DnaK suppressor protein
MQKKKNVKSPKTAAGKTKTKKIVAKTPKKVLKKSVAVPATKPAKKPAKISHRDKKLLEIKKKLLAQKKTLLIGAIEALNELPGQTAFPDLGDQATAEIDRNFMLRLKGRERKLLKKIDEAIDRIEHGVFGICDKCGCEIDVRRLEARPVTTMCIECKTLQEEEEKLRET